jgi:predicted amidophosphoribosyltransferase
MDRVLQLARLLVDLTCGARCVGCSRSGTASPCDACLDALHRTRAPASAAWPDSGVAARLVRAAKFGHWRGGGRALAAAARGRMPRAGIDLVTWVPGEPSRRARRGGHLPERLARAWARELGVPCVATLQRRRGPPQQGLDRDARRRNVAGAWRVAAPSTPARIAGLTVLLVDDLRTTGATLDAAAAVLEAAGSTVARFALVERELAKVSPTRCRTGAAPRS